MQLCSQVKFDRLLGFICCERLKETDHQASTAEGQRKIKAETKFIHLKEMRVFHLSYKIEKFHTSQKHYFIVFLHCFLQN